MKDSAPFSRLIRYFIAPLSIYLCMFFVVPPAFGETAKDLFYQEDSASGTTPSSGLSIAYALELRRQGAQPVPCNNRFPFQSGDGIKFKVKTNARVYAYILVLGSTAREPVLLYPPDDAEDNLLVPGRECLVPPHGQIVFDNNPGTEKVALAFFDKKPDLPRFAMNEAVTIPGDKLNGEEQKVRDFSFISEDGEYEAGERAPEGGYVYVNNPEHNSTKPTVVVIPLIHSGSGQPPPAPPPPSISPPPPPPQPSPQPESDEPRPGIKVRFAPRCLKTTDEAVLAFSPGRINGGARDLFTQGMNHLYGNYHSQQKWNWYFSGERPLSKNDSGDRYRNKNFDGQIIKYNDGTVVSAPVFFCDDMAIVGRKLNGQPNLAVGPLCKLTQNRTEQSIIEIRSTADLDSAWDRRGGEPLIIALDCRCAMLGGIPGGHVISIADRRKKGSQYEYKLFNNWGAKCNGWVGGRQLVSALNFTDKQHDESVPPHRAELPEFPRPITESEFLLPNYNGLGTEEDESRLSGVAPGAESVRALDEAELDSGIQTRDIRGVAEEEQELRQHIKDRKEGLTGQQQQLLNEAIDLLKKNKTSEGEGRIKPLSESDIAAVLHHANRMFSQADRVYAQGLDAMDRNMAVVSMLHDIANVEHVNQGVHGTCNVTCFQKCELLARPVNVARQFVDMYTNANGDGTVTLPK